MGIELDIARIADALEIIASVYSGKGDPSRTDTKATADAGKTQATKTTGTKTPTAAERKAAEAAAKKAAEDEDPLGLNGKTESKPNLTMEVVRDKLAELMEKDGKAAVFALLEKNGDGVKKIADLKKEHFEDVYNAAVDALA